MDCPACGVDMWGVEIRGVYDGVLFWGCPNQACRALAHRWPVGSVLRTKADMVMARWEHKMPHEPPGSPLLQDPQGHPPHKTPWKCDKHGSACDCAQEANA